MQTFPKFKDAKAAGMKYGVYVDHKTGWQYTADREEAINYGAVHDGLVTDMAGGIVRSAPGFVHVTDGVL